MTGRRRERCISANRCSSLDLLDGSAGTLLTNTDDESKIRRHCCTCDFNYIKILAFVQVYAFTG